MLVVARKYQWTTTRGTPEDCWGPGASYGAHVRLHSETPEDHAFGEIGLVFGASEVEVRSCFKC
jgi:hypothetical protein